MALVKALLAGLVSVSLSMADISGIVTDTGSTPISGVVVQLEKGKQKATTGADGSFTIKVATAALPGAGRPVPHGLSAGISGNVMTVTIAQRSAVEVATIDLTGKVLSLVRQTMDAGSHSLLLPNQGTGIYLYKMHLGGGDLMLKGNASGSPVTSQGSSSTPPSKQAKTAAVIKDVIAATKTGYLNYRMVVTNPDTAGMEIKMIASAGTLTDADGNEYQTVKIGKQVWMAENLRVTKYNDGTAIPLDTSKATWARATTPKYCFYKNTTNSDSIRKYGALYNGYVIFSTNSTNIIAPTGWHVPTDADWDTLQNHLIANGYNWDTTTTGNKIAKAMASKTDWQTFTITGAIGFDLTTNNSSGFSALPGGFRSSSGAFDYQSSRGYWWSATREGELDVWIRELYCAAVSLDRLPSQLSCGYSVRLLKN
jgi:uncharacterized protein (TIGR02145 family)